MGGVFISYRREDSGATTRALYERLAAQLGKQNFFIDLDKLTPGARYRQVLDERLQSCDALLAVIGKSWLIVTDPSGRRRLDDPEDILRREIASALMRNIVVIPVLVNDAQMPSREQLPADIAELAECQNVEMPDRYFDIAAEKLVNEISKVLPGKERTFAAKLNSLYLRRFLPAFAVGLIVLSLLAVSLWALTVNSRPPKPSALAGGFRLNMSADGKERVFDQNDSNLYLDYDYKGTVSLDSKFLKGKLLPSTLRTTQDFRPLPGETLRRIIVNICYWQYINNNWTVRWYPEQNIAHNSTETVIPLNADTKVNLPAVEFQLEIPKDADLADAWLCIQLNFRQGFIPVPSH